MINGSDKVSEFPEHFNKLESQVAELARNTQGIKIATWITAIATAVLASAALAAIFIPILQNK